MVTGRLRQRSWETPEGDKRSVTEIEADEVGASLKWATAKLERTSQRGNGDRAQGRERAAERGGDFTTHPHSEQPSVSALGSAGGAELLGQPSDGCPTAAPQAAPTKPAAGSEITLLRHLDQDGKKVHGELRVAAVNG